MLSFIFLLPILHPQFTTVRARDTALCALPAWQTLFAAALKAGIFVGGIGMGVVTWQCGRTGTVAGQGQEQMGEGRARTEHVRAYAARLSRAFLCHADILPRRDSKTPPNILHDLIHLSSLFLSLSPVCILLSLSHLSISIIYVFSRSCVANPIPGIMQHCTIFCPFP